MFVVGLSLSSCSANYRFADMEPVENIKDNKPIALPSKNKYDRTYYAFNVLLRRPTLRALDVRNVPAAGDVNSMDNVPVSSWYEPRLGYREITPEELLKGPELIGPPHLPLTVVKAKSGGGNPGFIIRDAKDDLYLVKFDPPDFPAIETTTALIVNRLFWGFGYNVPEDYLFFFSPNDLTIQEDGPLSQTDVDHVLRKVAPPVNGRYRSTVSYLIQGTILGPIHHRGTRKGDTNDTIAHQNRRVLRALRVLGAFTNHSDIRIDNSLDVYLGEEGKGYVKHYLLDFGEAFGGHGAEQNRLWDGFDHFYSYKGMMKNMLTLGLEVKDWENLEYTKWKSVGAFEAELYNPRTWKETWPFEPIRSSRRDDDYWAAKVLSALTEEHLRLLIKEARYPEDGAAEYMLETLLERKRKTIKYFFSKVSPIEFVSSDSNLIILSDKGIEVFGQKESQEGYTISFYNGEGDEIARQKVADSSGDEILIPIKNKIINDSNGYLILKIRVTDRNTEPPPAQFHFITSGYKIPKLVGVVH